MAFISLQVLRRLGKTYRSCFYYKPTTWIIVQNRSLGFFWSWLNSIFNAVDRERLALVGADRACAEWLLRNGASVRLKGQSSLISDYNALVCLEGVPKSENFQIEEIFAKEAGLSEVGFEHLKGCQHIRKITFILCTYLDNRAIYKLNYVKDSLQFLEIRSCFDIDDDGILSLTKLRNLKTLILTNLASVRKKNECEAALKKALIDCNIEFSD